MPMGEEQAFLSRCNEVKEACARMENPVLVHHYDCDGLTSGSIAAHWFSSQGKAYRMLAVRKVDDALITSLSREENIIFIDLGSGSSQIDSLPGNVAVIDHHQVLSEQPLQANPHQFGFDGGSELSAAGCAHFVFGVRADLGIVGAVGDIQYPLKSLNRKMLESAISRGEASAGTDLLLFGRNSRPLIQFLLYADDPHLPGLTGNEEACAKFLAELGIPLKDNEEWRTYSTLSNDEKRRLVSALADLLSSRLSPSAAGRLTGEVYTLLAQPQSTELSDASEFSTLLNACGRNGRPEIGVGVCLGGEGAYRQAQALLAEHRRNLRSGIEFASKNAQDLGKFILIDARGVIADSIIGVVAGMLYAGGRKKPILALSLEEPGKIKLSTRGTRELVDGGLNLGRILSGCCAKVGGVGGGHNIAAGATIPNEKLDEFLQEFAKAI